MDSTTVSVEVGDQKQDRPKRIELIEREGEEQLSHYERSSVIVAEPGQPVARLVPVPEDETPPTTPPKLGQNVALDPDGQTIRATASGSVQFNGKLISVQTVLQLKDVDFSTGNIDFAGDIVIAGRVADLFRIKGQNISIAKALEAAEIIAAGNLKVAGGIVGKEKGVCHVAGSITARYISNATIHAGVDVRAHSEIANSRVTCGGRLIVERGPLLAGHSTANGGMEVRSLGATSQIPTLVEAGVDHRVLDAAPPRLAEIEQRRKQIEKTRQIVEPLLRNAKALTAAQKERATELLYEADEQEKLVDETLNALRKQWEAATAAQRSEVVVADVLYSGVTIRFANVQTTIATPLKGPVTITTRTADNQERIVATSPRGSMFNLESRPVENPVLRNLKRLLAA